MKKTLMSILIGASLLSAPVFAGEAERRAQVEELLVAMNADALMDAIYGQMEGMMNQMQAQLQVKESERPLLADFNAKVVKMMGEEMGWDKLKGPMIDIYVKNLTEKEISDMLAFYQSETGQSMVKKMPAMTQESMQMTMGLMLQVMPKLDALAEEFKRNLQAERAKNNQ
ncbi:DUF2059 domain-containing protein [Shewanella khirikhana]|uniref:DUF2059 domain-containing protein n=1 Tax=Shewanella khirikhana TaxID=1965282 RepID=A0ABN5U164_9GAMM|nr:DUF2059 domain-containing protein [Shewanella khirikhana]AZQ13147.1 hypothetical protein STH12_04121 [Shewanella khirikhana]